MADGTNRTVLVAAALSLAVVLVTAAALVGLRAATPGGGADLPDGDRAGRALLAEVAQLQEFVASARGLTFDQDVDVRVVALEDLPKALGAERSLDRDQRTRAQVRADALFAIGLVERRYDADDARTGFASAVTGFYDHETARLVVPDLPMTPYRRSVVVHELVHALDAQHHDLDNVPDRIVSEEAVAFRSLVEGNADVIELQYVASLSEDDRTALQREENSTRAPAADALPDRLLATFAFPYTVGNRFVTALRSEGGNEAVDAAFGDPPISTEQVIHPDRYRSKALPVVTSRPQPEGRSVVRDVLGEMGLLLLLTAPDEAKVRAAADGWGGDRFVGWQQGDEVCAVAVIRMDTPTDMDELVDALATWRADRPAATVERTGEATPDDELRLRHCVEASPV